MAAQLVGIGIAILVAVVLILSAFFVGWLCAQEIQMSHKEDAHGIKAEQADSSGYRMVVLVRKDLRMAKGQLVAQCLHAAVGAYRIASERIPLIVRAWENSGHAKVALCVPTEQDLKKMRDLAQATNLNTCLIRGLASSTKSDTVTVLAIGPAPCMLIDKITGDLKAL